MSVLPKFYVYVYLDTRYPGEFKYGDYIFDYKPFYIGKGLGRRYKVRYCRPMYFTNTIKAMTSLNLEPKVVFPFKSDDESECYDVESKLIELIGIDNLTNISLGGTGIFSGLKHSDESKNKISNSLKGNTHLLGYHPSENTRNAISKSLSGDKNHFYGRNHTEQSKALMKKMNRFVWFHNRYENLAILRRTSPPDGYVKGKLKSLPCRIRE